MHIFIGSTNPVKINALTTAASETWPEAQIEGVDVPSGIPDQPIGDDQTRLGAENRARAAYELGKQILEKEGAELTQPILGVGLEGGVIDQHDQMWSTVWAVVVDSTGKAYYSNGARFLVPEIIATQIRSGGEMGPIVAQLTGVTDVRQKQGMIGIITKGFIDRTEEYMTIVKMALGLWYGQDWDTQLQQSNK